MQPRQPPVTPGPHIWIVTDARNDAGLELAVRKVPRGSGLIFRHYHLPDTERRVRFARLARMARAHGLIVVMAGTMAQARRWGADGAYGTARQLACGPAGLRLVTVHSLREMTAAQLTRADAILLSPVHPTRSHPDARGLGPLRFQVLRAHSKLPVIALGGMNVRRARHLRGAGWAAIDSFLQ